MIYSLIVSWYKKNSQNLHNRHATNGGVFQLRKFHFLAVFIFILGSSCDFQTNAQHRQSGIGDQIVAPGGFVRDGQLDSSFSALPGATGSGTVNAVLDLPDGKTLIGGNIPSLAGNTVKDVVRLNQDGTPDLSFNTGTGSNGGIDRLHLQPDGKILVSGTFSVFNGVQRSLIVRLNQDGSVDPIFTVTSSPSQKLLVCDVQPDGKILICGNFTSVNGTTRRHLARLNPSGSLDTSFDHINPNSIYINAFRALPDGKMLVGGVFNSGNRIIRLDSVGNLDLTFNLGFNFGSVYNIQLLSDGKFIAAGNSSGDNVIRFNADGSVDPTFNTDQAFQGVARLARVQPDGKIIVGGDFTAVRVGSVTRPISKIARLNSDGSFDTTFASGFCTTDGGVNGITFQPDGKVLIGGSFSQVQNAPISAFTRVNADGSLDSTYLGMILQRGVIFSQYIYPDGKILVGGTFNMLNLTPRQFFGRVNMNGDVDNSFDPGTAIEGVVLTIVKQSDGKFLVGGSTAVAGNKALRRINPDGTLDTSFDINFNSSTFVSAIAIQSDGKILIGGGFTSVNGSMRTNLARLNADGSLDSYSVTFGVPRSGVKGIIIQADGKAIVGGDFFDVNGISGTRNIARLNIDGSVDTTFVPNVGGSFIRVIGFHRLNGKHFVAGTFSGNDGVSRNPLIRIFDNGAVDWSFNAGTLVGDVLSALPVSRGKIFVSGDFNSFGESGNRKFVARLLENGSLDYTFDSGSITNSPNNPNTPPVSIKQVAAQDENSILISGTFDYISEQNRWSMARLKINSCVTRTFSDFDGDGKTDVSVFRPSNKVWYRINSFNNAFRYFQFGLATDKLVPADYDGDGRTDIAVFRPATGTWYIFNSGNESYRIEQFGASGDKPFAADYDGDGLADLAVFRPTTGVWNIFRSSEGLTSIHFGQNGDVPVASDYDGDCKSDIAIYRPSLGEWWYLRSSDWQVRVFQFGTSSDKPVQADYTGDGRTDVAVWRPSEGTWYVLRSEDSSYFSIPFGQQDDIPTPGDYDADGKSDAAVFRPSNGTWFIERTASGTLINKFGTLDDIPVPSAFVP